MLAHDIRTEKTIYVIGYVDLDCKLISQKIQLAAEKIGDVLSQLSSSRMQKEIQEK